MLMMQVFICTASKFAAGLYVKGKSQNKGEIYIIRKTNFIKKTIL